MISRDTAIRIIHQVVPTLIKRALCKYVFPSFTQAQLDAMVSPCVGKPVFNTTTETAQYWNGTVWVDMAGGGGGGGITSINGDTGPVVLLTKSDIGLGNVDNTADAVKSVASAAVLTTPRNINGVSFNGSADIIIPTLYTADGSTSGLRTVTLGGNLVFSGNQVQATKFFAQAPGASTTVYPIEVLNTAGTAPLFRVNEAGTLFFGNATTASLTGTQLTFSAQQAILASSASATNIGTYVSFTQSASTASTAGQLNHVTITNAFNPTTGGTIFSNLNIASSINQTGSSSGVTRAVLVNNTLTSVVDFRGVDILTGGFAPVGGTSIFTGLRISTTINQTGGATGITRGIHVAATVTSAADFRAIETTVGNVTLNTTSGVTLIGAATTATSEKLQVTGTTKATKFTATSAGASAAVFPIELFDSGGSNPILRASETGILNWGSSSNNILSTTLLRFSAATASLQVSNSGSTVGVLFNFVSAASTAVTAGSMHTIAASPSWTVASGNALYSVLTLAPTVNFTGTFTGTSRALYINPTITSDPNFRAIEATAGKIVFTGVVAANFVDDVAAAAGGIPVGGLYHNAGITRIRLT